MSAHTYRPPTVLGRVLDHLADALVWLWQKHERTVLAFFSFMAGGALATVVILFSRWLEAQRLYAMSSLVLLGTFLLCAVVFAWMWEGRR